ncbi:hypothetical protein [Neisseria chenwenguii]|uniref:Uncharacterized protein n=1 Tax=Neisseria chenwenguii TaxID=1853278 RepID=A0A220S3M4_9NEIS|nr:hypothetical protein [Neisseria chenwenguii]ASK27815.1 hypothetical protein BG910_08750 [Neisseria chenwenguii]ROV56557.1 hypothetical protein EGS38_04055 [Neisseria chenwenguii]
MYCPELRKQMIIRKADHCPTTRVIKSLIAFVLIWGLWGLTAYLVANDRLALFTRPLIGSWTLRDIACTAFAVVLMQLVVVQIWGILMSWKSARTRNNRPTYTPH